MVFLDEPTIGLDVTMQRRIRAFIAEYNKRSGGNRFNDQSLYGGRRGAVPACCRYHHGHLPLRW